MSSIENAGIVDRLTALSERAAGGTPIEIVEVQLRGSGKNRLLRIYIDKPGGVTHGDCEHISENMGRMLDEEDIIPGDSYTLEVSSPGVDRKLTKPRDFERVLGQTIRVYLRQPLEGQKNFDGKLVGFANETLNVEVSSGETVNIPLDQVQKANLKFEW